MTKQPGSFKKFSIPPRLHDRLLERLSLQDYAKYLFFHNRYRRACEILRARGTTSVAIENFGESADWLRSVSHLMRRWSLPWAAAYIHHTFPAHEWPHDHNAVTVDPLTFCWLWWHGLWDPASGGRFRFQSSAPHGCVVCGRAISNSEIVLRYGLPTCGCEKRVPRPISVALLVSEGFQEAWVVDRVLTRCREQRVLDATVTTELPATGVVLGFVSRRQGRVEELLRRSVASGLPTFVFGENHASDAKRNRPLVGGLTL